MIQINRNHMYKVHQCYDGVKGKDECSICKLSFRLYKYQSTKLTYVSFGSNG